MKYGLAVLAGWANTRRLGVEDRQLLRLYILTQYTFFSLPCFKNWESVLSYWGKKHCFIQAKSVAKKKMQVFFLFPPSATGSPSATVPLTSAGSSCSIHVPTKLNTKVNLCFKTLHGSIVDQMALEDPNTIDPGRAIYSLSSHHRYLKMHTGRKCISDWDFHAIYPGDIIWASPFQSECKEVMETLQEGIDEERVSESTQAEDTLGKKESVLQKE